jgi:hypothetical protein
VNTHWDNLLQLPRVALGARGTDFPFVPGRPLETLVSCRISLRAVNAAPRP